MITGSASFVGRNLVENLGNIRDGKNCTRPSIHIDNIYEYDLGSTPEQLDAYCTDADFVFNLAWRGLIGTGGSRLYPIPVILNKI